jgi:DNA-binding NtrC family response regulator
VASLYDQRRRVRALEEQLLRDLEFHGIVGKSPVMLEVFDFARNVARHYTNVLVVGPTGTGKELVARVKWVLFLTAHSERHLKQIQEVKSANFPKA